MNNLCTMNEKLLMNETSIFLMSACKHCAYQEFLWQDELEHQDVLENNYYVSKVNPRKYWCCNRTTRRSQEASERNHTILQMIATLLEQISNNDDFTRDIIYQSLLHICPGEFELINALDQNRLAHLIELQINFYKNYIDHLEFMN